MPSVELPPPLSSDTALSRSEQADKELDDIALVWLGEFVDQLLIIWSVVGIVAVVVSVSRALFTGWLPIYGGQIALVVVTLLVTSLRRRLSATFKAGFAIVSNLAVATTGVAALGLMSGGIWFFPVSVLLLALFFTQRHAIWLTTGIFAYIGVVGYGHVTGWLRLPAPADVIATSAGQWAVLGIAAFFFFASLLLMVEHYKRSMAKLLAQLKGQRDEISRLADYDALTGLPVLRLADDRFEMACRRAQRAGRKAAMLFIDLDGFKAVNDAAGHAAGDHCLQVIARRLSDAVRAEDTASRLGGDEFIVVMGDLADPQGAAQLAAKLVEIIRQPIDYAGQTFQLGGSAGIALYPDHGADTASIRRRADQAMYAVKRAGKNGFAFAD